MNLRITIAAAGEIRTYTGTDTKMIQSLKSLCVPAKKIENILMRLRVGRVQLLDFGQFVMYVERVNTL